MIDHATLTIEKMATKTRSYREAFLQFMEDNGIYDPEDVLEVISPILKNKIREEFIASNNFSKDSEFAKRNSMQDFFDK